ncbi:MAG: hypothetical protein HXX17_08250 [Geobacteraceae bacterium]|nr:hypothetical protein [Geobacteraceae bacterium]
MTIYAQSILRRVTDLSLDTSSVRWSLRELVRYLNDGQREIGIYRPDATVTNALVTCVAGTKQTLPAGGNKLIEVVRNNPAGSGGRSVRLVQREILDATEPSWHLSTGSAEVRHYLYDPRDPKTFYVYPPATTAAKLDIIYSATPTDIAVPADGVSLPTDSSTDNTAPTVVVGAISVPDIYANALVDYVLYRVYAKDSDFAGNAARASAYYGAFANAIGLEIKTTVAVGPTQKGLHSVADRALAG